MTRELKLALIVGFLVVLVVFVLIADHWSTANRSELAVNTPAQPVLVPSVPVDVAPLAANETEMPAPTGSILSAAVERELAAAEQVGAGQPGTMQAGSMQPVIEPAPPIEIVQGAPTGTSVASADGGGVQDDLIRRIQELGGEVRNGRIYIPAVAQSDLEPLGGGSAAGVASPTSARPDGQVRPVPQVTEPKAASRWHTVTSGDSLFKIAKEHYGDGKHWRKLAEFNKDRVGADGTVRLGTRIELPPSEVITGKPASQPVAKPQTPAPKAEPRTPSRPAPATYTVRKGDTLGEIAQRLLGSSRRAAEIVELNKARIKDANNVPVGLELKLPEV